MSYENFTIKDEILSYMGKCFDFPIRNLLKKLGATDEQLNDSSPYLASLGARMILSDFICGRNNDWTYNLTYQAVLSLKQFTLILQDITIKGKVSDFLDNPTQDTAQKAIQEFLNFEAKHSAKETIEKIR